MENGQQQQLIEILIRKGIRNEKVLNAIAKIPRDLFVPEEFKAYAYEDTPLPLKCHQTITQPYLVAKMSEAILENNILNKVLEIGTGSGYQAAVLSQLAKEVYTIERIKTLLTEAEKRFELLKLDNIHTLYGDGYLGWPEHIPYNGILVTAATDKIPETLLKQMSTQDGRLVMPVGDPLQGQRLQLVTRHNENYQVDILDSVYFVPFLPGTTD